MMKGRKARGQILYPRHIAVIMDGNGRWAKKRLLPRGAGHRAGLKRMLELTEHAFLSGARYLTLYALSAENLQIGRVVRALPRLFFGKRVDAYKKRNTA